jgi:hypothetical protein
MRPHPLALALKMSPARITSVPNKSRTWLLILVLAASPSSAVAQKIVTVDYRVFPGLAEMDANWAALKVTHDRKVYARLACYGCDGRLVMCDPETERITDIGGPSCVRG